jgi:hypothetical protein
MHTYGRLNDSVCVYVCVRERERRERESERERRERKREREMRDRWLTYEYEIREKDSKCFTFNIFYVLSTPLGLLAAPRHSA